MSVARQTAIAIESARLYLETQRRAREMSALVEVGRDISASLDAATVLEGIASHAKDLLNGDTSALSLPESDGKIFRAITAVGPRLPTVRNETISWGEGILGNIAKNKIGRDVNDANNDPRAVTVSGTQDLPDEHIMAAPLLANDEIKGLMAVWRTGKGLEFTEFELEFLNNLSRQAVIAVQNAQLFAETTETLKQQTATSDILRVIASSPTDIQPVLDVVANYGAQLSDLMECAIFLVENGEMRLAAHAGPEETVPLGTRFPLNCESIAGVGILDRQVYHIPDINETSDQYPLSKSFQTKFRSFLAVPLLREEQAVGVIFSRRPEARPYTEKQIQLVQTFASQAIAIEITFVQRSKRSPRRCRASQRSQEFLPRHDES